MNHAIAGKPGGGKGVFSMVLENEDVIKTRRPIITDLAVEKNPWCSGWEPRRGYINFLMEKHGQTFDMEERLFRLKTTASTNYFLYRALNRQQVEKLGSAHLVGYREVTPLDDVLEDSEWQFHKDYKLYVADHESHLDKRGKKIVDSYDTRLALASGGHMCLKDEAWKDFPARGWSNTGEGILYYFSMVRRFGDDNWLVSQRLNDCDSILIDRCQDFWVCTNHGKLRFGAFRQPSVFQVAVYDHRPTPSSDPSHRKVFQLDRKGLAQCYDTSGGVGVAGRVMADIGSKTKGLPIWLIPVIGIVAIFLAWQGLKFGMGYVRGVLTHKSKPAPVASSATNSVSAPSASEPVKNETVIHKQTTESTNEVYCTGFTALKGCLCAFFSDGSTVYPPELEVVGRDFVVVSGKMFKVSKLVPVVSAAELPVSVPVVAPPVPAVSVEPQLEQAEIQDSTVQVTYIGKPRVHRAPAPLHGVASMQRASAGQ